MTYSHGCKGLKERVQRVAINPIDTTAKKNDKSAGIHLSILLEVANILPCTTTDHWQTCLVSHGIVWYHWINEIIMFYTDTVQVDKNKKIQKVVRNLAFRIVSSSMARTCRFWATGRMWATWASLVARASVLGIHYISSYLFLSSAILWILNWILCTCVRIKQDFKTCVIMGSSSVVFLASLI